MIADNHWFIIAVSKFWQRKFVRIYSILHDPSISHTLYISRLSSAQISHFKLRTCDSIWGSVLPWVGRGLVGWLVSVAFFLLAEFKQKSDLTSIHAPAQRTWLIYVILFHTEVQSIHDSTNLFCCTTFYFIADFYKIG